MVSEGKMNLWNVVNEILDKVQWERADRDGNLVELEIPAWQNWVTFYIYLCSAWVVMLMVILWDWTGMKMVLSPIASNVELCKVAQLHPLFPIP